MTSLRPQAVSALRLAQWKAGASTWQKYQSTVHMPDIIVMKTITFGRARALSSPSDWVISNITKQPHQTTRQKCWRADGDTTDTTKHVEKLISPFLYVPPQELIATSNGSIDGLIPEKADRRVPVTTSSTNSWLQNCYTSLIYWNSLYAEWSRRMQKNCPNHTYDRKSFEIKRFHFLMINYVRNVVHQLEPIRHVSPRANSFQGYWNTHTHTHTHTHTPLTDSLLIGNVGAGHRRAGHLTRARAASRQRLHRAHVRFQCSEIAQEQASCKPVAQQKKHKYSTEQSPVGRFQLGEQLVLMEHYSSCIRVTRAIQVSAALDKLERIGFGVIGNSLLCCIATPSIHIGRETPTPSPHEVWATRTIPGTAAQWPRRVVTSMASSRI